MTLTITGMALNFYYKKNAFLIVDPNKQLSTGARYIYVDQEGKSTTNLLYSDSFETEDDFDYAIALDHELVHYIQELTFDACITESYLTDYIKGYLPHAYKIFPSSIIFPFNDKGKFNDLIKSINNKDDAEILGNLKLFYDLYEFLFIKPVEDENFAKYNINVAEEDKPKFRLTFKDLLESHAYHKAYWDFFCRNQEQSEGCELLHSLSIKNKLFPYHYDSGQFECNNFKKDIYWRKSYMLPYYLVLKSFPIEEIKKDYVNYCNLQIPHKYSVSAGNWVHALFLLTIETAMGIPCTEYIIKQAQDGNDLRPFSPVFRFYKILDTIRKDANFLFFTNGQEDYCKTFFNHIAADNGWMDFDETASTMAYSLQNRAEMGHEVYTHYQISLWIEKLKGTKKFIHRLPIELIKACYLPVLIQQDWGINIEFHFGNMIDDKTTTTDFYTEYFRSEIKRYEYLDGVNDQKELLEKVQHNSHGAIREIVNRLFAADTRLAHTKNLEYHCPLSQGGCQNRCPNCASFKRFQDATQNCTNKIFRFGDYKSFLENGGGNTPDCMYYNYLLDNGFNINNINF